MDRPLMGRRPVRAHLSPSARAGASGLVPGAGSPRADSSRGPDAQQATLGGERPPYPARSPRGGPFPRTDKEILILSAVDGLSPAEIGTRLGISAGAARSRLMRARRHLRDAL